MFVVQVSSCAVLVVLAVCVGWSQEQDYEPLYLGTFATTAHRVSTNQRPPLCHVTSLRPIRGRLCVT